MKNWIGFAAYLNQDCFASPFFANLVSMQLFLPVFKREFASGLYSVHLYYFGNWFCKLITIGFYPVLLISIIFFFLDLTDSSLENYLAFVGVCSIQSLNALTFGHMWSSIFDNE